MMHSLILYTNVKFNDRQLHAFERLVGFFAPIDSVIVDEPEDIQGFKYSYTVRSPNKFTPKTTEYIVKLWDKIFPKNFDIEISIDSINCADCETEMDDEVYEAAINTLSKFLHNRWVEEKVQQGWRYDTVINENEKTSYKLRSWDNLPESYRKVLNVPKGKLLEIMIKHPYIFN